MKDWLKGISLFMFLVLLTACGSGEADSNDAGNAVNKNKSGGMTVEKLFQKAQQADLTVTSMHADIDMTQNMSSEEMEINSVIDMQMDIITEPLAMYQQMVADVEGMGQFEAEMYMVADGFYMKIPGEMGWMNFSNEAQFAELLEGNMSAEDVQVDYAMLEEFVKDFQLEETSDHYVLSLNASGEQFNDFVKEQMSSTGLKEDLDELEDMTVHDFSYQVLIDKETFQTSAFHLKMEIEVGTDEGPILINQDLEAILSQINEVPEITVPADIIDNAVSF